MNFFFSNNNLYREYIYIYIYIYIYKLLKHFDIFKTFYVLTVTLLTQGNTKLLQQLNLGFKMNWNKYQSKAWSTKLICRLHD